MVFTQLTALKRTGSTQETTGWVDAGDNNVKADPATPAMRNVANPQGDMRENQRLLQNRLNVWELVKAVSNQLLGRSKRASLPLGHDPLDHLHTRVGHVEGDPRHMNVLLEEDEEAAGLTVWVASINTAEENRQAATEAGRPMRPSSYVNSTTPHCV